jgi:hypothetical protein
MVKAAKDFPLVEGRPEVDCVAANPYPPKP